MVWTLSVDNILQAFNLKAYSLQKSCDFAGGIKGRSSLYAVYESAFYPQAWLSLHLTQGYEPPLRPVFHIAHWGLNLR